MKTILILLLPVSLWAWGSQSLDGWVLGTNEPEISSDRLLHDGSSCSSIYVPVGTSPFIYETFDEGEGSIEMWIYDPGNCLDYTNPGYPNDGPMWGLMNGTGDAVCVGIGRASYVAGCQGYTPWSTVAPYSYTWYAYGMRGSCEESFEAGWIRWIIDGKLDDITFSIPDVIYDEIGDGCEYTCREHDCTRFGVSMTYDATYAGGSWESAFGEGWQGLYLRGDAAGGVEDISIDIVSGTGVFAGINGTSSAQGYQDAGWNDIKSLFR